MSENNSSKGASKLASIIQSQMTKVSKRNSSVCVELGEIQAGKKLKVDSLPGFVLDKDDYSVCKTISETEPLKKGDRVLVVWTNIGEPVVIDKIVRADKL